jgi:hypothetical protein
METAAPKGYFAVTIRGTARMAPHELGPLAFRITDVCRISGLGRTTIYAAIANGELTAKKCGRRTVILMTDLALFLDQLPTHMRRPGPQNLKPLKSAAVQDAQEIPSVKLRNSSKQGR